MTIFLCTPFYSERIFYAHLFALFFVGMKKRENIIDKKKKKTLLIAALVPLAFL